MSKSLVIVESPAKAKTINKYLGSQYVVKSSVGHICDLPTAGSSTGEKAKPVSTKGLSAEEKNKIKAVINLNFFFPFKILIPPLFSILIFLFFIIF